jgi:hypothetical protein
MRQGQAVLTLYSQALLLLVAVVAQQVQGQWVHPITVFQAALVVAAQAMQGQAVQEQLGRATLAATRHHLVVVVLVAVQVELVGLEPVAVEAQVVLVFRHQLQALLSQELAAVAVLVPLEVVQRQEAAQEERSQAPQFQVQPTRVAAAAA